MRNYCFTYTGYAAGRSIRKHSQYGWCVLDRRQDPPHCEVPFLGFRSSMPGNPGFRRKQSSELNRRSVDLMFGWHNVGIIGAWPCRAVVVAVPVGFNLSYFGNFVILRGAPTQWQCSRGAARTSNESIEPRL